MEVMSNAFLSFGSTFYIFLENQQVQRTCTFIEVMTKYSTSPADSNIYLCINKMYESSGLGERIYSSLL